jgi:uncharacterized integral membrane protein
MRYIRYAFLAILTICLVTLALANRGIVTLKALPEGMSGAFGMSPSIELPLFIIIFLSIAAGLLIGFIWEWMREYRHRADARQKTREVGKLKSEIDALKQEKHEGKDEVLALLEGGGTAR